MIMQHSLKTGRWFCRKHFGRFDEHEPEFQQFVEENRDWVEDYGLYMALKVSNGNQNWQSLPEDIQNNRLRL